MGVRPCLVEVGGNRGDEDTVAALRLLLALAEKGEIVGVAYVALHKGSSYSGDVTGAARDRPIYALGLAHVLGESVSKLIR